MLLRFVRSLGGRGSAGQVLGGAAATLVVVAAAALVIGYAVTAWDDYDEGGVTGGRTVVTAGLTVSALVLPIVIITTMEALRAVPRAIREAGYGVGASRWEVTRELVLPAATPGILTGTVLSLSRAVGEAAPILLVGAITLFYSEGDATFLESLRGSFTALPAIIFGWSRQPGDDYQAIASAAIIVILVLTFALNAIAIWLRNRFERSW
jgi:phosphate transport system permease protein